MSEPPSAADLLDQLDHANSELVTRLRELARVRAVDPDGEHDEEAALLDEGLRRHLERLLEAVRQVDAAAALPRQVSRGGRAAETAERHLAVVPPAGGGADPQV